MAKLKYWFRLCLLTLLATCVCVISSKGCPKNWKEHGNSCYLFVNPTIRIRLMSWEDSKANCLGYGADLVSIHDPSEVNFIHQETSKLGNLWFWIGLYRNKTTNDAKVGWIWSDGSNLTNPQWAPGEPNNYQNNEKCGEIHANNKLWNDNDCSKQFASICKRKKGLPDLTTPTAGTLPPTKYPPPKCDHGWVSYNRSCYRIFSNPRNWFGAKSACRDTGGHLVRIDDDNEQKFLAYQVLPRRDTFWLGLNDLATAGQWVWEFRSNDSLVFKNWQTGEPNGLGRERCVEMYGFALAGRWNDAYCNGPKSYICEKEEGQNICPEGWIPYNDTCYQFNMRPSQKMTWTEAEAACNAIGNFASLVQINSQSEQDFVSKRIKSISNEDAWIGLSDLGHEDVFLWTATNSELGSTGYKIWANGNPTENAENRDCVMILGARNDGAWSVKNCTLKRNFVCMRNRDLTYCNGPLGMENGKISDSQITASSYSPGNEPARARLRHSGAWCPVKASQDEYLQVEFPFLADIRMIVTEGNLSAYKLKIGKDGKTFKDYNAAKLTLMQDETYNYTKFNSSLIAKAVRIFPLSWKNNPCFRVEFVGCRAPAPPSTECKGKNWVKGPGKLCFQINTEFKTWEAARATCLERGGDLLTITNDKEMKAVGHQIKHLFHEYYWISLNERDYINIYDWSNGDPNGIIEWGSGSRYYEERACVRMRRTGLYWNSADCSERRPYICMKGEHSIRKDFVEAGPTGFWISGARYYWPLSTIENNKILGTTIGKVNGKVNPTTGVKGKANTALQFSGEGSYIDLGKFDKECFGNTDYCIFGLSLSFMAWFDTSAISWTKRVNILDSLGDETTSKKGISVYVQNKKLWFVVSRTSGYQKISVPVVDNEWRHYVMRWNNSLRVFVNGKDTQSAPTSGKSAGDTSVKSFKIGLQSGSGAKAGLVKMAMVAFWNTAISNDDIALIYTTEFGTCPFGWIEYGMSCYQLNMDTKTYSDARIACEKSGGGLMNIGGNVEQAFIGTKHEGDHAWIGVYDEGDEGRFVGSDGKPIVYSNWNGGQPDNWRNNEDCGHLLKWGRWNDLPCGYKKQYICEKGKELNSANITTTATPDNSFNKSGLACPYTRTTIGCPSSLIIKIYSAYWGRRDKKKCTYASVKPCGKDVTQALKTKCDNFENCGLHASPTEPYLSDVCPNVHKYLEVDYGCTTGTLSNRCQSGWKNFKDMPNRCYRLYDSPKTWSDARKTCKDAGGDLITISGKLDQEIATSLMERAWYSNVWIGLHDTTTKGIYEWSDGSRVSWVNWYVGQPDERRTDKSCVYMSLERAKRGWMYWRDSNCTDTNAFMCAYDVGITQKPATVPTVFPGKCRSGGWVTKDKLAYCYYYYGRIVSRKWLGAKSICRSRRAKLVSIQSIEENEFVRNLSNNTIWLGLESRGVFRGHVWSDGQPVRYTNWAVGQPDSYNGLDACVEMNSDTGVWSDKDCNEVKDIVCKVAKTLAPVTKTPVIYPTAGSPLCKSGWTLFQGQCYIRGNATTNDYLTWQDAEKKCQGLGANNGHLASIGNQQEQRFIEFLTKSSTSSNFWIGLNDLGTEAEYKWSDGSLYNYANWGLSEPNDYSRQEDCVHITSSRKWNDHHCQLKFSFICKAYNETYKPPVKPTAPPRPPHDGYCPEGWIAHAKYCYQFHTDPSEYRTWDDARDACERGHNSSSFGELASIHDEFTNSFMTIHIKGATNHLWIGLSNIHGFGYLWLDNTAFNYMKWNTREPRFGWNKCVEIVPFPYSSGRWNSIYCSKLNGYICQRVASDTPVTPTPTVKASNCKNGYKSFDESCFKFVNDKKTFDEARKVCQNENGDLMTVDDQFRQAYLIYLLEKRFVNVWIGFYHEPYVSFKFVDHTSPMHTYWGPGQPSRQLDQRSCVQANVTGSNFGVWDDMDCDIANPFICEIYKGEPKVTIPLNGTCQNDWTLHNKHCYKHFTMGRTWSSAQYDCSNQGADLVSIHDDREQDFLLYYFQSKHPSWIWIGLNDRDVERGYRWIDNSPVDYLNWGNGEPNDYNRRENCVEMQTRSGRWNDLSCSRYRAYVCKKKLECFTPIPLDPSMVTVTDSSNATSMGAEQAIIADKNDPYTSWCTNNTSGSAKIKIDLNQLVHVTGITVMGRSNQFVKSFRIDYERDENWRVFYPNRDYQTTIDLQHSWKPTTKKFRYPFEADGLSITPVTWTGDLICMRIRLHGCPYVCQKQLFLSSPTRIKDNVISASSTKSPTNAPKQTAIQGHSWCAEKNDKSQWIQFYFDKESVISVIRTFGDRKENYVTKYFIQYGEDGKKWSDYTEHGVKRIFQGNNDAHSPVRHTLANKIETSYVRLIPLAWNNNICMRISLLGCLADCAQPLLATGRIRNLRSFSSDKNSKPEDAFFKSGKAWCTEKTPFKEQYLEFRFGVQYRLSKIATLPSPTSFGKKGEISTFTLRYKKGKSWYIHGPKGQPKVMTAVNKENKSNPMFNALTDFYRNRKGLRTNGIRIYPESSTGTPICIKVELFGCLAGTEIIPTTQSTKPKPKVVKVSFRITSIEWNDKLGDSKTEEFAKTSEKIIKAVESVYQESESFRKVKVIKLTKGSVVAVVQLTFNPEFATDNDTLVLKNAVESGKIGSLEVDKNSYKYLGDAETKAHTGDGDSEGLSGGAVAGIVITVLILVALAAGAAFFLYRRKKAKSLFAPKHFDNPISYSSKAYDMDD